MFAIVLGAVVPAPLSAQAQCFVPTAEIVSGGPGRDGIPSLTNPRVVDAAQAAQFLGPDDLVLGVVAGGEARAYPHGILWWHEIVNDVLGGRPIVVSYCPLTGSGMVYDAVIGGAPTNFGVSGLLFDNNLILFDRATQSLWSQMAVASICGRLRGTLPALLPVVQSTWRAWSALHPETGVVSFDTGFRRDYRVYPYGTYDRIDNTKLLFPQGFIDERRPLKELVLGLADGALARAYPYTGLGERLALNDTFAGRPLLVVFDAPAQMAVPYDRRAARRTLTFDAEDGPFPFRLRDRETGTTWDLTGLAVAGELAGLRLDPIPTYSAMWFAWASFHPGTEIATMPTEGR